MEIEKLVRPNILALKPYSSARDEYTGSASTLLDANENPFPTEVNRYPDPYQRKLKGAISKLKQVEATNIFLGNGSDEAIDLLFRTFCRPGLDNVVSIDPTYGMYEVSAGINDVAIKKVPLTKNFELNADLLLKAIDENTKLIFICSPNNPSGNLLYNNEIEKVIEEFKGLVVIDEAYIDFAKSPSFTNRLDKFENLVILQTFSKAWGMAGVRLGMAFANEKIIKLFNKVKPPYNINELTQKFALQQLENMDAIQTLTNVLIEERERLDAALNKFAVVIKTYPSDSNFILTKFKDSEQVYRSLVEQQIIVRDRSKVLYGDNCLRITVGTPDENNQLLKALSQI